MKTSTRKFINKTVAVATLFCMTTQGTFAKFLELANVPLFIGANVPPQVMLTISKEQQLFKKAYNDYSDLDEDGQLETTYKHDIDYYGYFDSFKCYNYDTGRQMFVPVTAAARNNETDDNGKSTKAAIEDNKAAKYCGAGSGLWSGNFLNWISMSRMDTVRKLLYGGMRALDTGAGTVLERAHLPADAHAWAKYYPGKVTLDPATGEIASVENDIDRLTPFSGIPITPTPTFKSAIQYGDFCVLLSAIIGFPLSPCGVLAPANIFGGPVAPVLVPNPAKDQNVDADIGFTDTIQFDPVAGLSVGDQILFEDRANPARFFQGVVLAFPVSFSQAVVRVRVHSAGVAAGAGGTPMQDLKVTNLSRAGITFCNVTIPRSGNLLSQTNQDPPLIRAALGNFALWSSNERFQCYWRSEPSVGAAKVDQGLAFGGPGAFGSNSNQSALSGLLASAENPAQFERGLGAGIAQGDYVARVQACVTGLFGTERCKQYPSGNYKPIGLLQEYGDGNLIQFGLMTGSYRKNISGGVLRKNVGTFNDEVNLDTDGTFKTPAVAPGSPRDVNSAATPQGIVNTLNYIRIWGYDYNLGVYRVVDNCTFQLTNITENNCTSWGNPMSEIYFESLRYFTGKSPTPAFTYTSAGSKDNQLGLPLPAWSDPLSKLNYCAPLNVLVFNASVSTNEDDLRDTPVSDIGSTQTAAQVTNTVGDVEGISGNNFFIGKLLGASATAPSDPNFELCTPKKIPGLGDVSGICPEGPTVAGSYLMAGLAYQAHTTRIRNDIEIPKTDERSFKVTTYGIQLATNVPTLPIPVPGKPGQKVIIQPIYRLLTASGQLGGGSLVDLKFIEQKTKRDGAGNIVSASGKVYINWEDSEQGGDYDQDMWGVLSWEIDSSSITVTTNAIAKSTANPQGFGYAITGTQQDGPHFHSGIEGFNFRDPTGVLGCTNCRVLGDTTPGGQTGARTVKYNLGPSTGQTLQDPMWYAAKYGAFIETDKDVNGNPNPNKNSKPDVAAEWDSKNTTGRQVPDGIPDTYFLVTNPLGLVAALDRAFIAILSNASASSVATNSTQLQAGTTIYQARFNGNDWSGQVLALTVDAGGSIASVPLWDAGQIVNAQDPLDTASPPARTGISTDPDVIKGSGRTIITVNDSRAGVAFRWPADPANPTSTDIGKTLIDALNTGTAGTPPAADNRGSERLNYLRGSQASEGATERGFRVRPISRLGDIVNSNPNFIAAPSAGFGDAKYAQFRKDNIDRTPMIYVGGNDGMLHGFRAADGREVLAYVPSMVHKSLNQLTDKLYVGNNHRYFVDGSPEIGDAFITTVGGSEAAWRTVLVGSLGGGGQGLFALDVTTPSDFTETNASKIALWEFTDKDDPDLGFIYAQPVIKRMANGRFAAIVPGGYNNSKPEKGATPATDEVACTDSASRLPAGCTTSSTGAAYLFIVFLDGPGADGVWDEGKDYIKIRAGSGADDPTTPNGLTQPLVADVDADGFADFIYAGDLQGNLWKFDVRLPPAPLPAPAPVPNPAGDTSLWVSGDNHVILFVARDPGTNVRQAITAQPNVTLHPTTGFIVAFGTGKYLERTDPFPVGGPPPAPASAYQPQTFYGIWDKNDAKPIAKAAADPGAAPAPAQTVLSSRDQLLPHQILVGSTSASSLTFRVVTPAVGKPDVPDWSTDTSPPTADDSPPKHMGWLLDFPDSTTTGERSVFRPIIQAGRLIFSTTLPLTATCQFGGTSFTMVVDPVTGGRIDAPVLDTDANGLLNSKDVVSFGGTQMYASGVQSTIGITPTPTIIRASSLPPGAQGTGEQILGTSGPLVASQGVLLAYALAAGSSGGNASTVIGLSAAGGRVSWRELLRE